jgi:hypothetical protein
LQSELKLTLNFNKTKIINLNKNKVFFLGANILKAQHTICRKIKRTETFKNKKITSKISQRNAKSIRFEAPLDKIRFQLTQAGFINHNRPNAKTI